MKTDLNALKKELKRLTDVAELKKEMNRLAVEARKFDFTTAIPAAQRTRLEKRYRGIKTRLVDLQKRLDTSLAKFNSLIGRGPKVKATSAKQARTTKKTARKTSKKKVSRQAKAKSK